MIEELLGFKKKDAIYDTFADNEKGKTWSYLISEELVFPVVSKKDFDKQVALAIEIEESQNKVISNLEQQLAEKEKAYSALWEKNEDYCKELAREEEQLNYLRNQIKEKDKQIAELKSLIKAIGKGQKPSDWLMKDFPKTELKKERKK